MANVDCSSLHAGEVSTTCVSRWDKVSRCSNMPSLTHPLTRMVLTSSRLNLHLAHHSPRLKEENSSQQSKRERRLPQSGPTTAAQKCIANHFEVVTHRHDVRERLQRLGNVCNRKDVARQ